MTDKQIIIDEVDVSGCESFCRGICCQEGFGASASCKLFSDCLYKQLKRKEQECKELKEKLENHCFDCDVAERMAKVTYAATGGRLSYSNYTVEAIEQAYNDQLYIDVEYRTKEIQEELNQLKTELEQEKALKETYLACYKTKHEDIEGELFKLRQYKASKQASYEALQKKCNKLELENRKLEADNDILTWQRDEAQKHQYCLAYDETCLKGNEKCIYSTCAFKSIFKLKALVQDIKHIAEDQKDVLESMRIDIAEQILNKISEVLDEKTI